MFELLLLLLLIILLLLFSLVVDLRGFSEPNKAPNTAPREEVVPELPIAGEGARDPPRCCCCCGSITDNAVGTDVAPDMLAMLMLILLLAA